jgi:Protein of unknown function (DUF3109)
MLIIEKTIVSDAVMEEQFMCNLNACKGACCVEGDEGAPLSKEEAGTLKQIYDKVKPFLADEGIRTIAESGLIINTSKGLRTNLMKNGACVFVQKENGIEKCGIEKAWQVGEIVFRKPVSCHLYPVRVQPLADGFMAVNYEEWDICKPGCELGKSLKTPVFRFLREALIRKFGAGFYEALEQAEKQRTID